MTLVITKMSSFPDSKLSNKLHKKKLQISDFYGQQYDHDRQSHWKKICRILILPLQNL